MKAVSIAVAVASSFVVTPDRVLGLEESQLRGSPALAVSIPHSDVISMIKPSITDTSLHSYLLFRHL